MRRATDLLLQAQSARFTGLDPMLPAAATPPDGDVLTAALPDGERVAGVVVRTTLEPGSVGTLWSALDVWELHPLLGMAGGAGMEALLREWRRVMARGSTGPDSACVVTWPARDAEATRALLDHGFVPLSAIAIRTAAPAAHRRPGAGGLVIRRAGLSDADTVVRLELAELEYSALVGGAINRPEATQIKRASVHRHLERGDPVWLAERDGVAAGMAQCWLTEAEPGSWTAIRLPTGRWGYVNCLSVLPGERGTGVGQALMAVAHRELYSRGAVGTFLYYHPPNPLSSVFWARQGYRPLWITWEVRPAGALR
ncbi:MAG TPA: GNAT family N-acetyltransferase [Actinophytocola sp.]|uniref:GNAT family N-acetyltransferase n=1 Tax=Actinophytocola sp. TaxID=1872138 RepID=UPI002DDD57C8|nr:GNAT family N-acetyltransferase [Actinophytocola sp.]HEV2780139.1 GNAT family N-acetyltransferase [Actinophytocola sp.]